MPNYLTPVADIAASVVQLEYNTPALGGEGGIMNAQAQALLNRTTALTTLVNTKADDAATTTALSGKQPLDATLTALAGVTTAADKVIYATAADTFSTMTVTATARTLLDDTTTAAMRTTLGAQTLDPTLTGLAAVTTVADNVIYSTASDVFAATPLTVFGRSLIDDADAATALATLGAAPLASPTFTGNVAGLGAATGTSFNSITGLSSTNPLMDSAVAIGTGTTAARADHVHPVDTSRAPLASPTFTGTPTAPTAAAGTNTTQIATMAAVQTAIANLVDTSPATLNTLNELAAALGDDPNFATTMTNALAGKQPLDADLTAIAALAGTSGLLKKTAADTWTLSSPTTLAGYGITDAQAALTAGVDYVTLAGTETLTNKTVTDNVFTIQDNTDNTKKAQFDASGITTATTHTYKLPNLSGTLATIGTLTQTFTGTTTFSGTWTASGATATLGSSTAASTYGVGTGATISGATKTINIGTAGVAGSTTRINLGSTTSSGNVAIYQPLAVAVDITLPVGTSAQRPTGANGKVRYNSDLNGFEGYANGNWGSLGGGAIGGNRNKLINGNFAINQRAVSGTVTLAAGAYGHDRWKAGASGCTYTFATVANITTITITAGTLVQVIEGLNLQSGAHTLSWLGTAQGRVDSGGYASSPLGGTAIGGTNQSVEFGIGTLSLVQYEYGGSNTLFEHRPIGTELALCQRYYQSNLYVEIAGWIGATGQTCTTGITIPTMRATPTLTATYGSVGPVGSLGVISDGPSHLKFSLVGSSVTGFTASCNATASAEL